MHDALNKFFSMSLNDVLTRHESTSAERQVIDLFEKTVKEVPAYRDFLEQHGVDPSGIKDFEHFQCLPLTTKDNYMRTYPLAQRCPGGQLRGMEMFAASSGSTGEPLFWPRTTAHELDNAVRFEQIFTDSFGIRRDHDKDGAGPATLAVICFSLGSWVGGMYSAACCRYLTMKGYPVATVTPGSNQAEIFRVIETLGPEYDQVVLLGYPPFIKDVIDHGIARGIDWSRYTIKMIFAGEVFSEAWRNLVCQRAGAASPQFSTASLYGTADAGVLGNETPLSITIRRFLADHPEVARELFGESRLPTLVQYDPLSRYFEVVDNTLVVSGDNGVPLVRYHIADRGGIIACQDLLSVLKARGFDPARESQGQGALQIRSLPFVYLFGRADFTVSYFGANIYPENIAVGLEQTGIHEHVSGKFVLQVRESDDLDRYLSIAVELLPDVAASESLQQAIADSIRQQLLRLNSEFAHYVPRDYQQPRILLCSAGDPGYFPPGVKHRYTRKEV